MMTIYSYQLQVMIVAHFLGRYHSMGNEIILTSQISIEQEMVNNLVWPIIIIIMGMEVLVPKFHSEA